jgi:tRNA dimethylallyltransferase
MEKPLLVLLTGPTAVGKTNLSIELAKEFNTEILSCDSRQFFKELSIGTAVPTEEELAAVPHHFIQHISIQELYSVGKYELDALKLLETLFKTKNIAFVVGGSGLYHNALLHGIDDIPAISQEVRDKGEEIFANEGIEALQKLVQEIDPVFWENVDRQNHRRLMRTLELFWQTGKPLSYYQENAKAAERSFRILKIAIVRDRGELYQRINLRVDQMLKEGLEREAKNVHPFKGNKALNTVGYQEFFDYFENQISYDECVEKIKQNTRRYAKKQFTWIRRDQDMHQFEPHQKEEIIELIKKNI